MRICFTTVRKEKHKIERLLTNLCEEECMDMYSFHNMKVNMQLLQQNPPELVVIEILNEKNLFIHLSLIKKIRELLPYTFFVLFIPDTDSVLRLSFRSKLKVLDFINFQSKNWKFKLQEAVFYSKQEFKNWTLS